MRIQEIRKSKGIKQKELAAKLGIAANTLSQYETGNREPDLETIKRIALVLEVTVDELLDAKTKAPTLTKKDERDIEKKLADILANLESGQDGLMFSGESIDPTTRELLADSLRNSMEMGKKLAKQKYTPKKYRKED